MEQEEVGEGEVIGRMKEKIPNSDGGFLMEIKLQKWSRDLKWDLMELCNKADRTYLSDRMPYPYTEEDADWYLGMVSEHDGKDGLFRAIVVDGKIAGNITIEQKADVYCKDCELGYLLLTDYWSRGIMTEAVRQFCAAAFAELDIIRITGLVYEPNAGSRRVLEKNGFVKEGLQRNAVYKDGKVFDLCLYGKLK